MTADEILAVIRERVKKWRGEIRLTGWTDVAGVVTINILDDLDPDRIDAQGKLREELARDIAAATPHFGIEGSYNLALADALLKKGWRK